MKCKRRRRAAERAAVCSMQGSKATYERYPFANKLLQQLQLGKTDVNAMVIGRVDCKFAVEEIGRWCDVETVEGSENFGKSLGICRVQTLPKLLVRCLQLFHPTWLVLFAFAAD